MYIAAQALRKLYFCFVFCFIFVNLKTSKNLILYFCNKYATHFPIMGGMCIKFEVVPLNARQVTERTSLRVGWRGGGGGGGGGGGY